MFERFSDRARKIMALANQEAQHFNSEYIDTEHILLGFIKEGSGVGATVLKNLNVDIRKLRLDVEKLMIPGQDAVCMGKLPHTPNAKKVIEYAIDGARSLGQKYLGSEHILLGLTYETKGSIAAQVLKEHKLTYEQVRKEILNLVGQGARDDEEEKFVASPFQRFTDRARKVLALANQEAQRFNHEYIGSEHILLGLVKEGSGVGATVLKNFNIDIKKIRDEVEKYVKSGPDMITSGRLPHTPSGQKVLEYALEEARSLNHNYVGTEHLMLGLLHENEGSIALLILKNLGIKLDEVRNEILKLLTRGCEPVAGNINEMPTMLFSNRASEAMESAQREAQHDTKKYIDSRHILLGLINEGGNGTLVLRNLRVDLSVLHLEVRRLIIDGPDKYPSPEDFIEKITKYAIEEIRSLKRDQIGTEHLLLGLLREPRCDAAELLMKHNLTYQQVRNVIVKMAGG